MRAEDEGSKDFVFAFGTMAVVVVVLVVVTLLSQI
jgi:hypothetical protein